MTTRYRNPDTGQVVEQQNGQWVEIPIAQVAGEQVAAEQSSFQAAMIGSGRATTDLWHGARELAGFGAPRDPRADMAYQALQQQHPVATAVGESMPFVGAGVAAGAGMGGAGMAANLVRQAEVAGALGLTMPGNPVDRLQRGAIEGATGAVGELGTRVLSKVAGLGIDQAGPAVQRQIARARELGYRVMPTTGLEGRMLKNVVQGGLEASPGGALEFDKIAAANQSLLNRHAAEAIGESTDALTSDAIDTAFSRIGKEFDRVFSRDLRVPVDDDLLGDVLRIDDERVAPMLVGAADPVRTMVDRTMVMLDKGLDEGGLTGATIHAQQSKLGKAAWANRIANPDLSHALSDMQDALLRAAQRSMPEADRAALQTARKQYRNLMSITAGQNVDPVSGTVHAGRVANTLQRKDPTGWTRGKNTTPFYEGVRFLARTQPPLRSSGTAERSAMREVMKMGALGAGAGAIGGQDFETTLGGGLAGIAGAIVAPNLAARMYTRPGVYNWLARAPSAAVQGVTRAVGHTAYRSLGPRLPERLVAPVANEEWFDKWANAEVKPEADNPRSHAIRLSLLSKGEKLTKEQKKAVSTIISVLKSFSEVNP